MAFIIDWLYHLFVDILVLFYRSYLFYPCGVKFRDNSCKEITGSPLQSHQYIEQNAVRQSGAVRWVQGDADRVLVGTIGFPSDLAGRNVSQTIPVTELFH